MSVIEWGYVFTGAEEISWGYEMSEWGERQLELVGIFS